MAGYTRQSASNIVDDGVINASDFNNEYNAIETAFNASSGHVHDGTAANGARILEIGPSGDFTVSGTAVIPLTTNTLDIGSSSVQFKNMYLDGFLYVDGIGENILVDTDKRIQFRDTALYLNSSADGQLDIVADTEVQITTTTLDINADTDVSGTLAVAGTGDITGDTTVGGTLGVTGVITATADIVANSDVTFSDSSKAVFGAGSDLEIYHNGSDSFISDNGDGDLYIRGSDNIRLQVRNSGDTAWTNAIKADDGAATSLMFDGDTKLATTSTGVGITGGFDARAASIITTANNTTQLTLQSNDADATEGPRLDLRRNSASPADGDIIGTVRYLGEDSSGTNLLFSEIQTTLSDVTAGTVDASLDLFIRRNNTLVTGMSLNPSQAVFNEAGNDVDFRVESDTQTSALFVQGSSGNIGLGTGSPQAKLDVQGETLTSSLDVTGNASVGGNATISGNLTVSGTTFTVDSTVTTLQDPILTLGGDSAPESDDNKDRGLEFRWHNGSAAKVGFFGFDDSTGRFTFIPDATNTNEVFSGTKGTIDVAGIVLNGTTITATAAEINKLDGVTASTAELNLIDGVTATTAELNYVDGVTSNIQTQLNAKQATLTTGDISTALIADDAVTADKIADNAVGADAFNIAGDGTSGQVVQSDGDGSFSYLTLPATFLSGMVMPYAGASAPSGWLLSYGQAISRSTYSALFSAIGTTYGVGNGSTTFNVPDFRGRTIAGQDDMGGSSANRLTNQSGGLNGDTLGAAGGSETHTLTEAQMPSHTHFVAEDGTYNGGAWGLSSTLPIREGVPNDTPDNHQYYLKSGDSTADVGLSSATGSGSSHNNVQPTIILNYIIKT